MLRPAIVLTLSGLAVGCSSNQPQARTTAEPPAAAHEKPSAAPVAAATAKPAASAALSPAEFRVTREAHPDYVLLDVRSPAEYAQGHLEGARLMDFRSPEFDGQVAALDPSKTYLVYCRTGHRSGLACEKLAARGIACQNMTGGITGWRQAGLPVTTTP